MRVPTRDVAPWLDLPVDRESLPAHGISTLVGSSEEIRQTLELISRLIGSQENILILGGTEVERAMVVQAICSERGDPSRMTTLETDRYVDIRSLEERRQYVQELVVRAQAGGVLYVPERVAMDSLTVVNLFLILGEFLKAAPVQLIWASPREIRCLKEGRGFCDQCAYRQFNFVPVSIPPLNRRDGMPKILLELFKRYDRGRRDQLLDFAVPEVLQILLDYPWRDTDELDRVLLELLSRARGRIRMTDPMMTRLLGTLALLRETELNRLPSFDSLRKHYIEHLWKAKGHDVHAVSQLLGVGERYLKKELSSL